MAKNMYQKREERRSQKVEIDEKSNILVILWVRINKVITTLTPL